MIKFTNFSPTSLFIPLENIWKLAPFLTLPDGTNRSSRSVVFCKKGVLKNFTKVTGKHLCQSLFFNKVAGLVNIAKF